MATEDTGRDLSEVERLQRKQDALERDMTAIEGKLKVRFTLETEQLLFC
jgi:Spectrin repeat.